VALHLRILLGALEGLHYAHELVDYDGTPLHVVHRDVSPQNIFVTYDGQVKLVDFGIAKANDSSSETQTGILKGKVAFMSPEQARGERADRRADIFAVGILLAEALSGKKFWDGLNDTAILHRLLMNSIPEVELQPGVPEALRPIARRALAFHREDRYPTAEAMLLDIEAVLGAMGNSTNRELGKLVTQLFADRRREIKTIIDGHLRQVSAMQTTELRAFDMLQLNETLEKVSSPSLVGAAGHHESGATFASQVASLPPDRHPSEMAPAAGRVWLPLAVAVGFGLAGITGTVLWFKSQGASPSASTTPAITATHGDLVPSAAAASPGPAGAVTSVSVSLRASPATARLILDNVPLPANPYQATRPADGAPHELRIEAPGYATRTEKIRLDRDVLLELALDRDPGAGRPVAGRVAGAAAAKTAEPAANTTPTPESKPETRPEAKPAKPKRDIDLNDPYKQP
jgi:serine/threonine-protein kinase